MAAVDDLTFLRTFASTVSERLMRYRAAVRQVEADYTLSQAGRRERVDALTRTLLADIDGLEQQAKDARQRVAAEVERRFQRDDSDPVRSLLREIREWRCWQRVRPLLDRTDDPMLLTRIEAIARQASAGGDVDVLWSLDAELPIYLEVRGQAGLVAPALAALRRALLPHLAERQREALGWADELAQGWPNVMATLQQARLEASGRSRTAGLPGWRGESVAVA